MAADSTTWGRPLEDVQAEATSLVDVYRRRAQDQAEEVAYTFLGDGESERHVRTYQEMDRWARAIGARLQELKATGQRALLIYDAGLDYVATLAGCLYAGVVAVPAYPPDPMRIQRTLPRLKKIVEDSQATLLLTTSEVLEWAGAMFDDIAELKTVLPTDEIDLGQSDAWQPLELTRGDVALLQYTSGSTGAPKGVVISHGNVLSNLEQIHQKLHHPDNVAVSWLPAYHDMGLIGILQAWYSHRPMVLMSPLSFFTRPIRWLRAISDYRGTICPSPNFGYDICVRKTKPEQRESLDLSCWSLAMNGAEPVRPDTIERFLEAFGPCGMRREAFYPCYGMAETTLMIAGGEVPSAPRTASFDSAALRKDRAEQVADDTADARRLVGCGQAFRNETIAIVDPETCRRLGEREVGEIWVAGPNVAVGYWQRPEETEETFRATTADGDGPFLRTGDLGFIAEGELFVAGRLKDLVIFCGSNHYPQDIERTVEGCHCDLKAYGGAVFSLDDGYRERIVIVHEVSRPRRVDLDALLETIRHRVAAEHQVPVDAVVLIRQGSLPKTSSGKTRRSACRDAYLAGQLPVLAEWRAPMHLDDALPSSGNGTASPSKRKYVAPRTETEKILTEAWADVLGSPRVGIHDDFFALGGNSLLATQLVTRLSPLFNVEIPLSCLFDYTTVATLAEAIDRNGFAGEDQERLAAMLDTLEGLTEGEVKKMLADDKSPVAPPPCRSDADRPEAYPEEHSVHENAR